MHLAYCDESGDPTRTIASAVVIPDHAWRASFEVVRDFRKALKTRYGIPIQYELHARKLVGGKGSPGQRVGPLGRHLGCKIFIEALDTLNTLGALGVYGMNISLENSKFHRPLRQAVMRLFQRFENNLTKNYKSEYGLVFYDGTEGQHGTMAQRLLRRMQVYNPVPSMIHRGTYRMMPIRQLLGDPTIRDSTDSFIQLADMMAYALLRQDNPPSHPVLVAHGIGQAFNRLSDLWLTAASKFDPQGVVRD